MSDISMLALETRVTQLEQNLQIAHTFNDINLVRSYVAETALAFLATEGRLDLDAIEKIMLEELDSPKRTARIRDAVKSLRQRVADPRTPQPD